MRATVPLERLAAPGAAARRRRRHRPHGAVPALVDPDDPPARRDAAGPAGAGGLHVAVPADDGWRLEVAGEAVPARTALGWSLAFDVGAGGDGALRWRRPPAHLAIVAAQALAWAAVAVLAVRLRPPGAPAAGPGARRPRPSPTRRDRR